MFFEAAELPADAEAAPAGVLLWRDRAAAGSASASPNRRVSRSHRRRLGGTVNCGSSSAVATRPYRPQMGCVRGNRAFEGRLARVYGQFLVAQCPAVRRRLGR
jgi:hypothetical protein